MDCFQQIIDDVFKSSDEDYSLDLNFDDEDSSWLDGLIEDIPILNDCMFSSGLETSLDEGVSAPRIQSEHSYSLSECYRTLDQATNTFRLEMDNDLESPMMMMVDPNLAMSADEEDSSSMESSSVESIEVEVPSNDVNDVTSYTLIEVQDTDHEPTSLASQNIPLRTTVAPYVASAPVSPTYVLAYQPATRLVTRTPTIIVTKTRLPFPSGAAAVTARTSTTGFGNPSYIARSYTTGTSIVSRTSSQTTLLKPMHVIRAPVIKDISSHAASQEQFYKIEDDADSTLPPSPPSSDGERSSPKREYSPSSPSPPHGTWVRQSDGVSVLHHSYQTAPQNGRLIITEEERRTLISEGYPVPTKLPLTKQEENNLKKIQRKIKNKTSAQESRRKKKVYLDALEKQLEVSHQENGFLKKQLESLQTDNKSLMSQVHRLESLASKLKPSAETSTCIMVFALFFAMFMGTFWTPAALAAGGHMSVSWAGVGSSAGSLTSESAIDSKLQKLPPIIDEYRTPNIKSRMLMMIEDTAGGGGMGEDHSQSRSSSNHRDSPIGWLSSMTCSQWSQAAPPTDDNDDIENSFPSGPNSYGRPMSSQQSYVSTEGMNDTSFDKMATTLDVAVMVYTRGPAAVNGTDIRFSAV